MIFVPTLHLIEKKSSVFLVRLGVVAVAEDLTNVTVIKWLSALSPRLLRKRERREVRLVHRLSKCRVARTKTAPV
jgi:hypothetical protein